MRKIYLGALLVAFVLLIYVEPSYADNCGSLSDCFKQSKTAAIAVAMTALLASLLLDFSPIGYAKGLLEAVIGKDILTGDKLAWWERALNLVPGGKGIGTIVKTADELADIVKDINKLNKATDFTEIAKTIEKGGMFSEIRKIPAETFNKELAANKFTEPPFTKGTEILGFKIEKDATFVRVHSDGNTVGHWLLTKEQYNSYIKY